jgi:hypothetical protein
MRAARSTITIATTILLATALAWSQVCDLNCAFYGCAKPVKASTTNHCHEQSAPEPTRQGSQKCPGHIDSASMMMPAANAFHLLTDAPLAQPVVINSFSIADFSIDTGLRAAAKGPLRSPPKLSILRI